MRTQKFYMRRRSYIVSFISAITVSSSGCLGLFGNGNDETNTNDNSTDNGNQENGNDTPNQNGGKNRLDPETQKLIDSLTSDFQEVATIIMPYSERGQYIGKVELGKANNLLIWGIQDINNFRENRTKEESIPPEIAALQKIARFQKLLVQHYTLDKQRTTLHSTAFQTYNNYNYVTATNQFSELTGICQEQSRTFQQLTERQESLPQQPQIPDQLHYGKEITEYVEQNNAQEISDLQTMYSEMQRLMPIISEGIDNLSSFGSVPTDPSGWEEFKQIVIPIRNDVNDIQTTLTTEIKTRETNEYINQVAPLVLRPIRQHSHGLDILFNAANRGINENQRQAEELYSEGFKVFTRGK